jgi:hypothetical protein
MVVNCTFRTTGARPEIWDPETGRISPVALYDASDGTTRIPLVLPATASVFIVFRFPRGQVPAPARTVKRISRNGKTVLLADGWQAQGKIEILSAVYGKPGEPEHTRDATADVRKLVESGETAFPVVRIAEIGSDPDINVVKTLEIRCRINDRERHLEFHDGETVEFNVIGEIPPAAAEVTRDGAIQLRITQSGDYECVVGPGESQSRAARVIKRSDAVKTFQVSIPSIPDPVKIRGPWTVGFPGGWGAPAEIKLPDLIPLNEHSDSGVKYFSGTATYRCQFDVPQGLLADDHCITLDLGKVAVMADVKLNGQPLGVLWKSPFHLDVTAVLVAGQNTLEIAVANLWVNRLIGDQQLPSDAERNKNGTLKQWPQWLLDGKPSPTGRLTFTTWELWRKNDPLVESGLIGPVRLMTTVCRPIV